MFKYFWQKYVSGIEKVLLTDMINVILFIPSEVNICLIRISLNKYMKIFITWMIIFCYCHPLAAQFDSIPISKEIDYITDLAVNLRGGNQQGVAWLGQLNTIFELPMRFPGRWGSSIFHLHFLVTHGTSLSSLVGDMQVVSNIEAPGRATFFELWYMHRLNHHHFKLGLIDVNSEFLYTDWALPLVNSSFGIQPTLSVNIPLSIFPISALGMVWNYDISDWLKSKTGLFDGQPNIQSRSQVLPDLNLGMHEGFFLIQEFNAILGQSSDLSSMKLGAWIHTGDFQSHKGRNSGKNFGLYMIFDKQVARLGKGTLYGWVKSGVTPNDCNTIRHFHGGGLTYQNPFGSCEQDIISVAVASAFFCNAYKDELFLNNHETAIELTAKKHWNFMAIQPDIQYILNPSGNNHLKNPLCFILRAQFSF